MSIEKEWDRNINTMPPIAHDEAFARYRCSCGVAIVETFDSPSRMVTVHHGEGEAKKRFRLQELVGNYKESEDGPIHPMIAAWVDEVHAYEGTKP